MAQKSTASLSKKLDRYAELVGQRDMLQGILEKATAEKTSVATDIYERVAGEYRTKLDETETELEPLHSEIESLQKKWSTDLAEAETKAEELTIQMQETKFRHLVGEFDDPTFSDFEKPLRTELAVLATTADEIREKLDQIEKAAADRMSSAPAEPAVAPKVEAPAKEKTKDKAKTKAETKDKAKTKAETKDKDVGEDNGNDADKNNGADNSADVFAEPAEDLDPAPAEPADNLDTETDAEVTGDERQVFDEDLIDLTDWTKEFQRDGKTKDAATYASASATDVAMDTEGMDTMETEDLEISEDTKTPPPTRTGFPVLIIVKGPGEGKKLPLLPMTMTLGREHDNNLELKDEDVARYHARIAYRSGNYVLEDLESSSGTWVNGKRISETTLDHGDKLRVGSTELIIDFD